MTDIAQLETRVDRAWDAYVQAAQLAQRTLDVRDGISAARAWAVFLAEFNAMDKAS